MANFAFNIAKGRIIELYKRVENADPAGSRLVLIPLSASDTEANAQDADNVTAALATAMNEQSAGNWGRKDLGPTELAAFPDPDDTNNRYAVQTPQVTWTPGPTAGNNTTGLLLCYDASGSDVDGVLMPLAHYDFAVTADGNDVVINVGDLVRST